MDGSLFLEVTLKSADEMLDELLPHRGEHLWSYHGEEKQWLFRGQADAGWGLTPAAMRPGALFKYVPGQVISPERAHLPIPQRLKREMGMVMDFAVEADRAGFPLPWDSPELRHEEKEIDPVNFPAIHHRGLFALAQHYGVPTRLLDWTPRPLVAAYFACAAAAEDNKPYKTRRKPITRGEPDRCAIWAISQQGIAEVATDWDTTITIVTAPAALVPNLAAQAGCFTLVHYRSKEQAQEQDPPDLDELFRDRELPDGEFRWAPTIYKFTFPASEAGRLLYLLHLLDITAARLFPGLVGVERSMFERNLMILPARRENS